MYLDSAYIAKYYVSEPESQAIRDLVKSAPLIYSSAWALAEVQCVFHRKAREGSFPADTLFQLSQLFSRHIDEGLWNLIPVSDALLHRTSSLILASPASLYIRTADAMHLTTAKDLGEREVWTNDRHMLVAASQFGLTGRSL